MTLLFSDGDIFLGQPIKTFKSLCGLFKEKFFLETLNNSVLKSEVICYIPPELLVFYFDLQLGLYVFYII